MPQALSEWRAARGEVAHDLIRRTLLPFLSDYEKADPSERPEILGAIMSAWDEEVKPKLTKVIQESLRVLSPRLLLEAFIKNDEALSSLEQQAFQRYVRDRQTLPTLITHLQKVFEATDQAIQRLEKSPGAGTPEVRGALKKLHEVLQALPTSPVIP